MTSCAKCNAKNKMLLAVQTKLIAALKECASAIEFEVISAATDPGEHHVIDMHAATAKRARAAIAKAES